MEDLFLNKAADDSNLDLADGRNLEYYLELTKDYKSELPLFSIKQVGRFSVINESELETGAKTRFADFMFQNIKEHEVVYCQPRVGFGGISATHLAKKYGKKITMFMPACKEISDHQLITIELGADPIFRKIPAMPVLNAWAKQYAEEKGAFFIPFGLKHPMVTAGAVRAVHDFFKDKKQPVEMWHVISTGVLARSLQIALPKTQFFAVGVARNIQTGELGRASFISYHKAFLDKADLIPTEFDSAENYDAKGWEYALRCTNPGDTGLWFFNVAGTMRPSGLIKASEIDSQREWGEKR